MVDAVATSGWEKGSILLGSGTLIFATVGSMLPFERLVRAFDVWAASNSEEEAFMQIGAGEYLPANIPWARMLDSHAFECKVASASLIVSHAGIGTVFAALEHSKPIVVVPRYAQFREHTTDHQLHSAAWLREKTGIIVCEKDDDLGSKIAQARALTLSSNTFSKFAPPIFTDRLRAAIKL